jgi:hypothetical protein
MANTTPLRQSILLAWLVLNGRAAVLRNAKTKEHLLRAEFLQAMQQADVERHLERARSSLNDELLTAATKVQSSRDLANNYEDGSNSTSSSNQESSLDLTKLALKYVGCQNIHTFSDSQASNSSAKSPFLLNRFVILRLCTSTSCSSFNKLGCNSNYGEYTLPMDDYLQIMATYHFRQFDQYCEICTECMSFDSSGSGSTDSNSSQNEYDDDTYVDDLYSTDDAGAAKDDDSVYGDDDRDGTDESYNYYSNGAQEDDWEGYNRYWDGGNRQLGNGYNQYTGDYHNGYYSSNGSGEYSNYNNYPWYINSSGKCSFKSVCSSYANVCKSYSAYSVSHEKYFQCTAFQVASGTVHLGPHCEQDGHAIGMGIYSDGECSNYIGDIAHLNKYTGTTFDNIDMSAYYDNTCISCSASEGYGLVTDDAIATNEFTYPLCNVLYEYSAKCNRHISSQSTYGVSLRSSSDELPYLGCPIHNLIFPLQSKEASQESDEDAVCTFITSLVENNYNEYGEAIVGSGFQLSHWNRPQEYSKIIQRASSLQVFGLFLSIGAVLGLATYCFYLTKKLKYRKPWQPPTRVAASYNGGRMWIDARSEAGRISRINSGVVMMRSRSKSPPRESGALESVREAARAIDGDDYLPTQRTVV